ncbi:MAG: dTMP kinase [Desulfobacteraceae bacterium]|uniref:Thymidylate kinase n=1 Tax=Candidatus Desulfacyla euxinica TaxID=2841693 RepID=A0A8J6N1W0_9DELT|nr:dTMP kinase [Candidatus Desulfacyla euxinica]MBL6978881.1 dTMP kinase [Desulfobacteraceae bacterium]
MFITLEGIEGCGKSTQARRLVDRLEGAGVSSILTLEPGGTPIGKEIRRILLDSKNKDLSPLSELFLYEADRALHMEMVIKPALVKKKWVVCDRFFDATTAYQGYARGQDNELIRLLNEKASLGIRPDITFLIDCPVEVGLERALKRNEIMEQEGQDRFEREEMNFHTAVREGYLSIAKNEPARFMVVDGTLGEDELEERIFEHIRPSLSKRSD